MPRNIRQDQNNYTPQDPDWQQAWDEPEQIDAAKKQALLNSLHRRIHTGRRKRRLFFVGISAAAAILVAVFIRIPGSRSGEGPWQELASQDAPRRIVLQDSSVLWLAPHSIVRVHPDFAHERNVLLAKGSAFFSVAKDGQHSFSVRANRQQITVLGTAFTIHKRDSVDIQLMVKEGKVALDNPGGRQVLTAGQRVNTDRSLAGPVQNFDPADADWWLQPKVRWHNISLGDLLNHIEHYYQVKLSNATGAINRTMKVTLTWDQTISIRENLTVLNSLTGYSIH